MEIGVGGEAEKLMEEEEEEDPIIWWKNDKCKRGLGVVEADDICPLPVCHVHQIEM